MNYKMMNIKTHQFTLCDALHEFNKEMESKMENKKLTFNEETYEFNPYFPKGEPAYEVWVNSVGVKKVTPYTLQKVDNQFYLYFHTFFTMVTCSLELTFDDVIKVVSYIRNNEK